MTGYTDNLLGAVSLSIVDLMQEAVEDVLGAGGQAAGALILLDLRPNMTIKRLAERLRLSHPGAVRLSDRLAGAGWVERSSGEDRRTVRLKLTPTGAAQVGRLRDARGARLSALTARLSESELAALEPALTALMKLLTVDAVSAYANCRLCNTQLCQANGCPVDARAEELIGEAQPTADSPKQEIPNGEE